MGDKQSDRHIDEHILDRDKQELQSNPHDQPMIPKSGTNPAARDAEERKSVGKQARDDARTAGHVRSENADNGADDKIDEALMESFPASDPPAQP